MMSFDKNDAKQGDTGGKNNRPVLTNNDGVAVWLRRDKNGNAYLSQKIGPFGSTNVFPNEDNDGPQHIRKGLNMLLEYLEENGVL